MSASSPLSAYAGVRALVLGATGFIGRHVVSTLAGAGADVLASSRDAAALADIERSRSHVTVALCDVVRADDVAELVRRVRPTITFNLAGYGVDHSERDHATAVLLNAQLPIRLVTALAEVPNTVDWGGQAFVHVGSAAEYGRADGNLGEDTLCDPATSYGNTKLAGTTGVAAEARALGINAVAARLFTVYGPGEHAGRLLPSLLDTARTRVPLPLTSGSQRRDFTYVADVVEGLLRLGLTRAEPGLVVNLATGRLTTVREFVERAANVLGIDGELLQFGGVATRAEEMVHEPVSINRLRALTGWVPPTSIEDGVARTRRDQF